MFDFFLAMLAVAGNAASGDTGGTDTATAMTPPPVPAIEAPATPPEAPAATAEAIPEMPEAGTLAETASEPPAAGIVTGGISLLEGTQDTLQPDPAPETATSTALPQLPVAPDTPIETAPTTEQAAALPQLPVTPQTEAPAATVPEAPAVPAGVNMAVVPSGLVAEEQTPSGKFTTAAEVRPILDATRGSWIAVREYEGRDYLYVSHVWGWRCGLAAMAISVNGEPMQNWPLPACHEQYTTPNALLEDDALPVLTFRPGTVQTVTIQLVYDDLSMDVASFERGNVLIP